MLSNVALWFVQLGGAVVLIWVLFERAEKVASAALKASVRAWLKTADPAQAVAGWLPTFVQVFDRVFDDRHLSLKCFRRSCVASMAAVLLIVLYWTARRPHEAVAAFSGSTIVSTTFAFVLRTAIISIFPGYLSLLKSRWIIGWMNKKPTSRRLLVGPLLDFVSTVVVVCAALYVWFLLKINIQADFAYPLGLAFRLPIYVTLVAILMSSEISTSSGYVPIGIWPWATLFTTAWAILYALAGAVVILARYAGLGLAVARWGLDVDAQPIMSLGVVAMGLVVVGYIAWLLVYL